MSHYTRCISKFPQNHSGNVASSQITLGLLCCHHYDKAEDAAAGDDDDDDDDVAGVFHYVGEQYATTSDLVEALLAYSVAVSDIDTDIASCHLIPRQLQLPPSLLQQQQQQQQEQWAETVTTTSWSHDQHVSYDVTDDAATTAVATVISKRRMCPARALSVS